MAKSTLNVCLTGDVFLKLSVAELQIGLQSNQRQGVELGANVQLSCDQLVELFKSLQRVLKSHVNGMQSGVQVIKITSKNPLKSLSIKQARTSLALGIVEESVLKEGVEESAKTSDQSV